MRAWTLGVSVVFHLFVIASVIVAPLFATGDLPKPRRAAPEYILVTAHIPEPPPLRRPQTPAPQSTSAAPLIAPERILPETPVAPPVPSPDFGFPGGEPTTGSGFPGGVVNDDPLPPPPPPPPAPRTPVRVSALQAPRKIRDVAPRYPTIAQASRVEGVVILEAVIAEDGSVQDVRVLRSKPPLDDAAVEAVRQWRFTPTLLGGQPVPVVMTVTVSFTLNK
jgi:periplasmic protein TonB